MCLGVPGIIRERWQEADGQVLARGDFGGEEKVIRLNYLPDLEPGDWVITHAGFALTRLTPEDARQTLETMRDVGLLPDLEDAWLAATLSGHLPPLESAVPAPEPARILPTRGTETTYSASVECHDEVCITCSDQGIPAEILAVPAGPLDLARVRTATGEEDVDVMLVGPVEVGDLVLIHGGTALTKLEVAQ